MGAEHTGISGRDLKTQADQGFESPGRPFFSPPSCARGRNRGGAGRHGPSCAPNAPRAACAAPAPPAQPRARRSPARPKKFGRREPPQRPRRTAHWSVCPYAGSARSSCGCEPCRQCAPTKPQALQQAAPPRPTASGALHSAPTDCATRRTDRAPGAASLQLPSPGPLAS